MNEMQIKKNVDIVLEFLYLLIVALLLSMAFLNTTTFEIEWPAYLYSDLKVILFVVVILRVGYSQIYTKKELMLVAIIGIAFLVFCNRKSYDVFVEVFIFIIGAKDISLRKIITVYFAVTSILLVVTMGAALLGNIENLVYYPEGRRRRVSMGIGYPTDFSAHVFFGIMSYLYLRREKIKYLELVLIMIGNGILYWLTDARTNTICISAAVIFLGYNKWIVERKKKKNCTYEMNRIWSILLALSPVICGGFMIVISTFYNPHNKIMVLLNKLMNQRFSLSHRAIDIWGIDFWGEWVPMQGYGSTVELPKHYFYLDSSYVNIVMRYGIVILAVILLIWIVITFRAREEKDWALLWVIAIISVQCMVEHHMIEIAYNPFIWVVLASTKYSRSDFKMKKVLSRLGWMKAC